MNPGSVRISRRQSLIAEPQHDECGVEIALKAEIPVDIFGKFPVTANVSRLRVKLERSGRFGAALAG
jgi:hypothetical protein